MISVTQKINDYYTQQGIKIGICTRINGEIDTLYKDIVIGDYCIMAKDSIILTHCPIRSMQENGLRIRIGHDVYIGRGSIVLPGVTIGNNTIIGAGSVVGSDISNGVVAHGNPCRMFRKRDPKESIRTRLLMMEGAIPIGIYNEPDYSKLTIEIVRDIFDLPEFFSESLDLETICKKIVKINN